MQTNHSTSYSSVDDRFGFSRKGIFRCRVKNEGIVFLTVIVVGVIIEAVMLSTFFGSSNDQTMENTLSATVFGFVLEFGSFIFPFIFIGVIRTVMSGEEYSFTADEHKMLIICPKRDIRADIVYESVQSVSYTDLMFFSRHRGYHVEIVCSYGSFSFDFLFPYKAHTRNKDVTPFRIIEERCGVLEKPRFLAGQRIDDSFFK